jgi:BirA family biotin operon repressor/biotin-[acetyl-CoA-carboxylase] ligase
MDAAHPGSRFRVRHVHETGSTNADAIDAAAAGEPEGLVILADHQTAGRGRLGRTWVAAPGSSLLMSVLLRPTGGVSQLAVVAVGCAAAAACLEISGFEPGLKWPNDLIAGDRKLGGILAEATAVSGNMTAVVVGLGLNVHLDATMPEDLRETATALDQCGDPVAVDVLLGGILTALEVRYAHLQARCVTIGQRIRVDQPTESWEGTAIGVDDGAALLVERPHAGVVRVEVGDVVHIRNT